MWYMLSNCIIWYTVCRIERWETECHLYLKVKESIRTVGYTECRSTAKPCLQIFDQRRPGQLGYSGSIFITHSKYFITLSSVACSINAPYPSSVISYGRNLEPHLLL